MSSSSKNNGYVFEQQNDVRLNDLSSKISAIKNITIDIHQDVTDQDRLLDESHNQFGGLGTPLAKGALGSSPKSDNDAL
ncbi:hypothetical protein HPULCUR_003730 [Helicostylum pulchrum]|uniref:t-SNARE coiled-coil homology domain-containing protein n=1 Tax=Helicostylum pulchrum TaxID=562976 RepID=A0ABP9XU83_9FUNG